MKIPIYLFKQHEDTEKVLYKYTNFRNTWNGCVVYSKDSKIVYDRFIINKKAVSENEILHNFIENYISSQVIFKDTYIVNHRVPENIYLYKTYENSTMVIYNYTIEPASFGEIEVQKINKDVRLLNHLDIRENEIVLLIEHSIEELVENNEYKEIVCVDDYSEVEFVLSSDLNEMHLPKLFEGWDNIVRFAHTFHDENITFGEMIKISDSVEEHFKYNLLSECSRDDLRITLLLIERTCQHIGNMPNGKNIDLIYTLIDELRKRISQGI